MPIGMLRPIIMLIYAIFTFWLQKNWQGFNFQNWYQGLQASAVKKKKKKTKSVLTAINSISGETWIGGKGGLLKFIIFRNHFNLYFNILWGLSVKANKVYHFLNEKKLWNIQLMKHLLQATNQLYVKCRLGTNNLHSSQK